MLYVVILMIMIHFTIICRGRCFFFSPKWSVQQISMEWPKFFSPKWSVQQISKEWPKIFSPKWSIHIKRMTKVFSPKWSVQQWTDIKRMAKVFFHKYHMPYSDITYQYFTEGNTKFIAKKNALKLMLGAYIVCGHYLTFPRYR